MNGSDDNRIKMTINQVPPRADPALIDALLADAIAADPVSPDRGATDQEFRSLLGVMFGLADRPVPEPSKELSLLLGRSGPRRSPAFRRRNVVLGGVAACVVFAGFTGVAAANDRLPGSAQRIVSGVINGVSPLDLPRGEDYERHQPSSTSTPTPPRGAPTDVAPSAPTGPQRQTPSEQPSLAPSIGARPPEDHSSEPAGSSGQTSSSPSPGRTERDDDVRPAQTPSAPPSSPASTSSTSSRTKGPSPATTDN
jgi:hypothetical protein